MEASDNPGLGILSFYEILFIESLFEYSWALIQKTQTDAYELKFLVFIVLDWSNIVMLCFNHVFQSIVLVWFIEKQYQMPKKRKEEWKRINNIF